MTLFETLTLTIATITTAFLLFQINIAIKAFKADHERKMKQSTIEYLGTVWKDCRYHFDSKYGTDPFTSETVKTINNDNDLKATVIRMLAELENIAVGVNVGIYSKDILFRMSATSIIDMYNRLKVYIDYRRQITQNCDLYIEFQNIAIEFAEIKRIQPTTIGDIEFSKVVFKKNFD